MPLKGKGWPQYQILQFARHNPSSLCDYPCKQTKKNIDKRIYKVYTLDEWRRQPATTKQDTQPKTNI